MNIILSLDYELFFGNRQGTVERCMITPTEVLKDRIRGTGAKLSLFVDAGHLIKLEEYCGRFTRIQKDYDSIRRQLGALSKEGHDIQLHIHPHWEETHYDGEKWVMNTSKYKLADFGPPQISDIVRRYVEILKKTVAREVFAYRAGGWCIQPFSIINKALKENGIWLDSTIYRNGINLTESKSFDFTGAEDKTIYKFSDNPLQEDKEGFFTEVPIASVTVNPLFYWKLALSRIIRTNKHVNFGDGTSMENSKQNITKLLTSRSYSPVFLDGYKSTLLKTSLKAYTKKFSNEGNFVTIGHPKAFTRYSLGKVEEFVKFAKRHRFITYQDIDK